MRIAFPLLCGLLIAGCAQQRPPPVQSVAYVPQPVAVAPPPPPPTPRAVVAQPPPSHPAPVPPKMVPARGTFRLIGGFCVRVIPGKLA